MAERDVTGRVARKALRTTSRLRSHMQEVVPLGPLREQLTAKETRLAIQGLDPDIKRQLIQQVGDEEWRRMMEDLYRA